jgi:hypothetical protein
MKRQEQRDSLKVCLILRGKPFMRHGWNDQPRSNDPYKRLDRIQKEKSPLQIL